MSYLIKNPLRKLFLSQNASPALITAVRNHWNKDFKPAVYPQTNDEHMKSAQKYNLDPSEYRPIRDDGSGFGDYPDLPKISVEVKDPFYPWDMPELKRNFNEPMHWDFDSIREDRSNVNQVTPIPGYMHYVIFLGFMGGMFLLYLACEPFKMFHAVVPKQLPKEGKVHYTFETSA